MRFDPLWGAIETDVLLAELNKLASYFRAFGASFDCREGRGGVREHAGGVGLIISNLGSEGQAHCHGSEFCEEGIVVFSWEWDVYANCGELAPVFVV